MINFDIPMSTIRAILPTIPKKEVRFYLVGALFDLDAGRIVATDGHRMIVCDGPRIAGGGRHIIPRDQLAMLSKEKLDSTVSVAIADAPQCTTPGIVRQFELCTARVTVSGKTVDGTFPEYHRVIPRGFNQQTAQYNADYLADAQAALTEYFGIRRNIAPRMEHNGPAAGIMHVNKPGCFVVIMPQRTDDRMDRDMAAFIGCVTDAPAAAAA